VRTKRSGRNMLIRIASSIQRFIANGALHGISGASLCLRCARKQSPPCTYTAHQTFWGIGQVVANLICWVFIVRLFPASRRGLTKCRRTLPVKPASHAQEHKTWAGDTLASLSVALSL
jgi:hypothetical protein